VGRTLSTRTLTALQRLATKRERLGREKQQADAQRIADLEAQVAKMSSQMDHLTKVYNQVTQINRRLNDHIRVQNEWARAVSKLRHDLQRLDPEFDLNGEMHKLYVRMGTVEEKVDGVVAVNAMRDEKIRARLHRTEEDITSLSKMIASLFGHITRLEDKDGSDVHGPDEGIIG